MASNLLKTPKNSNLFATSTGRSAPFKALSGTLAIVVRTGPYCSSLRAGAYETVGADCATVRQGAVYLVVDFARLYCVFAVPALIPVSGYFFANHVQPSRREVKEASRGASRCSLCGFFVSTAGYLETGTFWKQHPSPDRSRSAPCGPRAMDSQYADREQRSPAAILQGGERAPEMEGCRGMGGTNRGAAVAV